MRILKFAFSFLLCLIFYFAANGIMSTLLAGPLAIGGSVGMDFPLARTDKNDPGVSAEGFYRLDPYEIRFHFGDIDQKTYSVSLGIKHFFSDTLARPYVEAALGPLIVNTEGKGLAYGAKPEASLGVDLGINQNLSLGAVIRYSGMIYFGSTNSGNFEANHGLSLLGNLIVWF